MNPKDAATQKQNTEKFGAHSIKAKMILLVDGELILMAVLLLLLVIPKVNGLMLNTSKNYLQDVTMSYGMMLEEHTENVGVEQTLDQNNLTRMLGQVGLEGIDSSHAFVVSPDGIVLYHYQSDLIGVSIDSLDNPPLNNVVSQVKSGKIPETEVVTYDHDGVSKYAAYYVDSTADFILGISADETDILADVSMMMKTCIVAAILTLAFCSILGYLIVRKTIKPIKDVTELVSKLSDLDFTEDKIQERLNKRKDETGSMSRAISVLRDKLKVVLQDLQNQSKLLFEASASLNTSASETANTVEQVEKAVNEISEGATSQADETQKATENVILMGNMVEETSAEVRELIGNATDMKTSGDDATAILSQLEQINEKTSRAIDVIYEQTNTTNESAMKIRDATSLITSIAEETNLLSLNASIEAARAGEQGRGFAVVASQIQKLAEQSNESARQIEMIIDSLISDSEKAVATMDEVKEIMNQQNENVSKTETIFAQVKNGIDSSIDGINIIADKAKSMDDARVNVVDVVQNLTAIAQENAASTEETSASVTEVSSIVYDISSNAEKLKAIADELDRNMKIFKI
ncbi:MAG: methyl-accepting chemotaxis protein [Lachnospiraceae bacterium]|nr:methyl-accepting chemotaxis protein [Lachnospiraceae bacterium]